MGEPTGSCIHLTALQIGPVGFEHGQKFPKVIGFPGLLGHHGTFDFWRIGLGGGFLFFLRCGGLLPAFDASRQLVRRSGTPEGKGEGSLNDGRFFLPLFQEAGGKGQARSWTSSAFKRVNACGATVELCLSSQEASGPGWLKASRNGSLKPRIFSA